MIDPARWWHSHNVRLRLTVWYLVAMVAVLAVYAGVVYTFVSRSVSESLDERLRADFFWAAATVDESPDGFVMSTPQVDLLLEEEPWVQVLSANGREHLLSNAEARRRPIPGSEALAEPGEQLRQQDERGEAEADRAPAVEPALQSREAGGGRHGAGDLVELLGDRVTLVGHRQSPFPSSASATLGNGLKENSTSIGTLNTWATRSASSRLGL